MNGFEQDALYKTIVRNMIAFRNDKSGLYEFWCNAYKGLKMRYGVE